MEIKGIDELKKEIIEHFESEDNDYECTDRLQVSLHEIVDDWVSSLSFEDILECLKEYSARDFETLDSGMYEGAIEKGFEHLCRVFLYCLMEQELWNDSEFNELQNKTEVAGIKLK